MAICLNHNQVYSDDSQCPQCQNYEVTAGVTTIFGIGDKIKLKQPLLIEPIKKIMQEVFNTTDIDGELCSEI